MARFDALRRPLARLIGRMCGPRARTPSVIPGFDPGTVSGPASSSPFTDTLAGEIERICYVYQLDRNERPIARDLRRLAERFGPDLRPRTGDPS